MTFTGHNGEISLEGTTLKIKNGKKDAGHIVRLSDVVSITLLRPKMLMAGCLHVQVRGAKTYSSVANATHYATDPNAVFFQKPQYDEAVAFKEALERAMAEN